jgi:hypothetical protein
VVVFCFLLLFISYCYVGVVASVFGRLGFDGSWNPEGGTGGVAIPN